MELTCALHSEPCRTLRGRKACASAGHPRALWPSRRCEVIRLAGLAQPGKSLQGLVPATAPHTDAWPHNCTLERRYLLLLLLTAASPAAGAGGCVTKTCRNHCIYLDTWPCQALARLKRLLLAAADEALVEYVNKKEGYRLLRPSAWEQTSKAGEKRVGQALGTP